MENPATWGPLERAIASALLQANEQHAAGIFGWSRTRLIANAVRKVAPLSDRDREVFVKLVRFVDREHDYVTSWCYPTPGDDCSPWCSACELLRDVSDDVLREARETSHV
jgi:hypothetical protein